MGLHEVNGGQTMGTPNINVLVAPDQNDVRHLLLTRHVITQQLKLPNDLLDAQDPVEGDVRLSLCSETNISAWTVPRKSIFFGNTQDIFAGGGRAHAFLRILPYVPEVTASEDFEALWVPLDEVTQAPDQPSELSWYANHERIVATATTYIRGFDAIMRQAQSEHRNGNFAYAERKWREAAGMLPDVMSRGRALRGLAASLDRLGDRDAKNAAEMALNLHRAHIDVLPAVVRPKIARELIESHGVVGRIMLRPTVEAERAGNLNQVQARAAAEKAVLHFDQALNYISEVEQATGPEPDQHKINQLSRFIIAHSLYGDPAKARNWTREAIRIARRSEAGDLPTADRSMFDGDRLKSRRVAIVRSWAAWSVSNLVRFGTYGRRRALNIAASHLGL